MPMTAARCTQCSASLQVDSSKDAAICEHCGTPFIVEKAINLHKTTIHAQSVVVVNAPVQDFEIRGGVLIKYHGSAEEVIVPKNILEIGSEAFSKCANLKKVELPVGIEQIASHAFSQCSKLHSVRIPNGLTTIDGCAFYFCSSLKEIILPNTITKIGSFAFSGCECLEEITIPANILKLELISSDKNCIHPTAFCKCTSLKLIVVESSLLAWQLAQPVYFRYFSPEYGLPKKARVETARPLSEKDKQMYKWMEKVRCRHCGGKFGMMSFNANECKSCGKMRDY